MRNPLATPMHLMRHIMSKLLIAAGAAAVLAGCSDAARPVEVGTFFAANPAVAVGSIVLPARLPDMRRLRPSSRRTAGGLSEQIGSATLRFRVDERDMIRSFERDSAPPDATIQGIDLSWYGLPEDSAKTLFSVYMRHISRLLAYTPRCNDYRVADSISLAVWDDHSPMIFIQHRHADTYRGTVGAEFIVGVTLRPSSRRKRSASAASRPCFTGP